MSDLIEGIGVLFVVLCAVALHVFYRTRHPGSLLVGTVYGAAGVAAIWLDAWWPLVAGFALAWAFKLTGLDRRAAPRRGDDGAQAGG
jgi:hypothetical protein